MSKARGEPEITSPDELVAAAKAYAETVDIDAPVHRVDWQVSQRAKNRAGLFEGTLINGKLCNPIIIRLTWDSYRESGWEEMKDTIRHELVHLWEAANFGEVGHGERFQQKAEELNCSRHCESFSKPRYRLSCTRCGEFSGSSHNRTDAIKGPDKYNCRVCECPSDVGLQVTDTETGDVWRSWGEFKQKNSDYDSLKPPYRYVCLCRECGRRLDATLDETEVIENPVEYGCPHCDTFGILVIDHEEEPELIDYAATMVNE